MLKLRTILLPLCFLASFAAPGAVAEENSATNSASEERRIAYIVSDLRIPFWDILWRGVRSRSAALGYQVEVLSAQNDARTELVNVVRAIRDEVDGIIVSPTTSSAAATVLNLANQAGIPVVIADIGTDGGDYVSYISSDNMQGAYDLGSLLSGAMIERGWQDGSVGVVGIPQKRANGQARTAGFTKAMTENGIKMSGLRQQADFSYQETFDHTTDLLAQDPHLRAIWLQGSDRYQGALDAIEKAGRTNDVLLLTFDAEPEFLDLIPQGKLIGAGMQQPFLMGEMAVDALVGHLNGRMVDPVQQLSVLAVSQQNITDLLPVIQRNVLGLAEGVTGNE